MEPKSTKEKVVKKVQKFKNELNGGRRNGENLETWGRTKRSKVSKFQRPQLVALPAAQTVQVQEHKH